MSTWPNRGKLLSPDEIRELSRIKDPTVETAILKLEKAGTTESFTAEMIHKQMKLGDSKMTMLVGMMYGLLVPPIQRVQHAGTVTHEHHHDVHKELLDKIDMVAGNTGMGTSEVTGR